MSAEHEFRRYHANPKQTQVLTGLLNGLSESAVGATLVPEIGKSTVSHHKREVVLSGRKHTDRLHNEDRVALTCAAINMVLDSDTPLVQGVPEKIVLSTREGDVSGLLMIGMDNGQMADELKIGEGTVAHHLRNLYSKIGAKNYMHAIGIITQYGKSERIYLDSEVADQEKQEWAGKELSQYEIEILNKEIAWEPGHETPQQVQRRAHVTASMARRHFGKGVDVRRGIIELMRVGINAELLTVPLPQEVIEFDQRERDVISLLKRGYHRKNIADLLEMTSGLTVATIQNIYKKIGAHNFYGAVGKLLFLSKDSPDQFVLDLSEEPTNIVSSETNLQDELLPSHLPKYTIGPSIYPRTGRNRTPRTYIPRRVGRPKEEISEDSPFVVDEPKVRTSLSATQFTMDVFQHIRQESKGLLGVKIFATSMVSALIYEAINNPEIAAEALSKYDPEREIGRTMTSIPLPFNIFQGVEPLILYLGKNMLKPEEKYTLRKSISYSRLVNALVQKNFSDLNGLGEKHAKYVRSRSVDLLVQIGQLAEK